MKKYSISKTKRLRSTPFTSRLEEYGVGGYTVYNHMLLPTFFKSLEEEYEHLKNHVQIWDVSVQRQIEVSGKDSYNLIQLMTCRDLSKAESNKCYYAPIIDKEGSMINDPLILKISDSKWRICIADSDVLLFAKGITSIKNFEVNIFEKDISTLAIQGPKSENLMKKIFGEKILELKFFNFNYFEFQGVKHMISKSGYSKQGGYEIYIENIKSGLILYDHFLKMGVEFDLKPGCPNAIERIEGGLLSYGNDMDIRDNPYECGFDKYVDLDSQTNFLAKESLKKIKSKGVNRKLMGVKIDSNELNLFNEEKIYDKDNNLIGFLRSAAFSPKFKKIVGIAMINSPYWKKGQSFKLSYNGSFISGEVCDLPIK
ncbi:MAG: dimethylsulfoniopropionate demethylase [Pelagibacteraceae bacterium TMED287]|nr:MAG: dimethylsulfoniopropionate demethylase [Pelagibacteraceae bacterium TMED287]